LHSSFLGGRGKWCEGWRKVGYATFITALVVIRKIAGAYHTVI
jgi:hypothetical protein